MHRIQPICRESCRSTRILQPSCLPTRLALRLWLRLAKTWLLKITTTKNTSGALCISNSQRICSTFGLLSYLLPYMNCFMMSLVNWSCYSCYCGFHSTRWRKVCVLADVLVLLLQQTREWHSFSLPLIKISINHGIHSFTTHLLFQAKNRWTSGSLAAAGWSEWTQRFTFCVCIIIW